MDKSLYTFISTHRQISDLQEVELAVLSNHLITATSHRDQYLSVWQKGKAFLGWFFLVLVEHAA